MLARADELDSTPGGAVFFFIIREIKIRTTVAHRGHYIKKVNCILNTAPYTNKKMLLQIKKDVAANKKSCCK